MTNKTRKIVTEVKLSFPILLKQTQAKYLLGSVKILKLLQ